MKTKKAAVAAAAKHYESQNRPYLKSDSASSLRLLIGELLLFGNRRRKVFWPFFDAILRQYIDLRLAAQRASDTPGSANARERVSG